MERAFNMIFNILIMQEINLNITPCLRVDYKGESIIFGNKITLISKKGRPPRESEKGAVRCCRRAMRGWGLSHFVPGHFVPTHFVPAISCPAISCPSHFVPIPFEARVSHFVPVPFHAHPNSCPIVPFQASSIWGPSI